MKTTPPAFLTPALGELVEELMARHETWFVGGCVRDTILGRPVNDVDIATSATPEEVEQIFSGTKFQLYPTGVDHGTWTIGYGEETYEVTSFRKDVATDGRRAVVAFSRDVNNDAMRRDFTMNALYMDLTGRVLDPTGEGIPDLLARRVRFVGNASDRCKEDYLRILRLFRFHALLGVGPVDPEAYEAARARAGGLRKISGERIWAELKKLLGAYDPTDAIWHMKTATVLKEIFAGHAIADYQEVWDLVMAERRAGYPPAWQRRYAVLAGLHAGVPFPASKAERTHMEGLQRLVDGPTFDVPVVAYKTKNAAVTLDAYLVRTAQGDAESARNIDAEISSGLNARLPLRASDLIACGTPAGPLLGEKMRQAEEVFLDTHFRASKDSIIKSIFS